MFDKELYWKRRNEGKAMTGKIGQTMIEQGGKRGQGDNPIPKRYAKGEEVIIKEPDGTERKMPNDKGSHILQMGSKINLVNRKEYRFNESFKKEKPEKQAIHYPPGVETNHQKMLYRKQLRSK